MKTFLWPVSLVLIFSIGLYVGGNIATKVEQQRSEIKLTEQAKEFNSTILGLSGRLEKIQESVEISIERIINGLASWYGPGFHGRITANGEIYDMHGFTLANRELALGTIVLLENTETKKFCLARVNDRGPYIDGRAFDVSFAVAKKLGMVNKGVAPIRAIVLGIE